MTSVLPSRVLRGRPLLIACALGGLLLLPLAERGGGDAPAGVRVRILGVPNGGIQPQAVVDNKGALHLIYFKGDPAAGDLFYVRREPGQERFSTPLRVNSQPGSAIALGTIRGGQIALGSGGRIHVVWNGSGQARPLAPNRGSPMLYARLDEKGTAFEPQRNLMKASFLLDGGGTVAADDASNVYVAWHGVAVGGKAGEDSRTVWLARSADDGKTFGREVAVLPRATGACGCCGMRIFADHKGQLFLLYRAASNANQRDMILLGSADRGKSFHELLADAWQIGSCPMSSEAFAEGPGGVRAAWETRGQVYFTTINPEGAAAAKSQPPAGPGGARQHPALAVNRRGEMLLAWTDGTGWQKGGTLAWQVFDRAGRPTRERGRVEDAIPVWGLPAVVAAPEGGFLVLH